MVLLDRWTALALSQRRCSGGRGNGRCRFLVVSMQYGLPGANRTGARKNFFQQRLPRASLGRGLVGPAATRGPALAPVGVVLPPHPAFVATQGSTLTSGAAGPARTLGLLGRANTLPPCVRQRPAGRHVAGAKMAEMTTCLGFSRVQPPWGLPLAPPP